MHTREFVGLNSEDVERLREIESINEQRCDPDIDFLLDVVDDLARERHDAD